MLAALVEGIVFGLFLLLVTRLFWASFLSLVEGLFGGLFLTLVVGVRGVISSSRRGLFRGSYKGIVSGSS